MVIIITAFVQFQAGRRKYSLKDRFRMQQRRQSSNFQGLAGPVPMEGTNGDEEEEEEEEQVDLREFIKFVMLDQQREKLGEEGKCIGTI